MKFRIGAVLAIAALLLVSSSFMPNLHQPITHLNNSDAITPIAQTEINWEGVGAALSPRNASGIRFNLADSAVVQLSDGTFRMYYGNFTEPSDQYNIITTGIISSATSRDGIHWTIEPGTRVVTQHYCPPAVNSAFRLANGTVLIYTGCGNVYDSSDGLNFVQLNRTLNAPLVSGSQGPGSYDIVPLANGQYRMYMDQTFNGTDPRYTVVKIYSYISTDGFTFTQESGVRLSSPMEYNGSIIRSHGHPLVYHLADGTWIMYFDTATVNPAVLPLPGDASNVPNPVGVAVSKDGLLWNVTRPTFVASGEAYQVTRSSTGQSAMVFGFYGNPQFPMPSYAADYGGGLYYALPYYHIIYGSNWYDVGLLTNSTISSWTFDTATKQTTFGISSAGPGFLNFSLPSSVLSGTISESIDGSPANPLMSYNGTDYQIYTTVPAGNHSITITGTNVFSSPPTTSVTTLLTQSATTSQTATATSSTVAASNTASESLNYALYGGIAIAIAIVAGLAVFALRRKTEPSHRI